MKKSSAIILFNENKEILVQQRTSNAPIHPNKWSLFGGEIEKEELPIEAIKRECLEELNYQLKNPNLILTKYVEELESEIYIFTERINLTKVIKLNEGKDMKWINLKDLNELDFQPGLKNLIKEIINIIKQ